MNWKPSSDEKRAIRRYAATCEGRSVSQLHVEIAERVGLPSYDRTSINVLLLGDTYETMGRNSDLSEALPWEYFRDVELTDDGKALLDFCVYERGFSEHGDLLTNLQVHVETYDGKPSIVQMTCPGAIPVEGAPLQAFHAPAREQEEHGSSAFLLIEDWKKRNAKWKQAAQARVAAKLAG